QRDHEGGRPRPHGGDVGQVRGDRSAADVGGAGPVPPEVPAVHEHVRGDDHPAVGRGQQRRVVAGPEQYQRLPAGGHRRTARLRRQPGGDAGDQSELADRGDTHAGSWVPEGRPYGSFAGCRGGGGRRRVVLQAYILIQTEVGRARDVAAAISGIDGVVRVDPVTGPYDVIVLCEARNVDELGKLIVSKVQMVPGITRTLTCSVVHL